MCASTSRRLPSQSVCQTSRSSVSRCSTRPGRDARAASRSNSVRVRSTTAPPTRTSRLSSSTSSSASRRTVSSTGSLGVGPTARGRRSIACTRATSSRGENGLAMYPSAPTASPMRRATSSARAVSMRTEHSVSARTCRHTSVPSPSGRPRSSTTRSGGCRRTSARPPAAVPTARTSNPALPSTVATSSRISSVSSTTSTDCADNDLSSSLGDGSGGHASPAFLARVIGVLPPVLQRRATQLTRGSEYALGGPGTWASSRHERLSREDDAEHSVTTAEHQRGPSNGSYGRHTMPANRGHRTDAPAPASRTRRLDLDVVRGLAILLALGWHFGGPSGNVVLDALQWPGEHIGWAGVDLFFVLSGFLMGRLVLGEHRRTGTFDGRRFSLRRILKLWPVLYLFLAVQVLFGSESLGSFLWQNALHVQNIAGTSYAHLWSLAVEEHFYLALALLFPVFVKRGGSLKVFAGILAGVLVAELTFRLVGSWSGVSDVRLQWRTWFHLDGLAAGVLLAVISVRWPERFQALQDRRRSLLAVLVAGVAVLAVIGKSGPLGSTLGFTVAWMTAAAALLLTYRATWVPRVRWIAAPVAALGRYSYGIYIWHIFAAGTVLGWLGMDREESTPLAQAVKYGSAIVVGIAATLLVERPVLRLRDRIWPGTDDEQRSVSDRPAPAPQVLPQEVPVLQAPVLLSCLAA